VGSYTSTEIAAWVGAVVAVLVLFWDIYKEIRSGARVMLTAHPNMRYIVAGKTSDRVYIAVTVINKGDLPTTLTHLFVRMYDNHLKKLCRKPSYGGVVAMQQPYRRQLPYVLKPGELWRGEVNQAWLEDLLNKRDDKLVYVAVAHSSSKRNVLVRIKL